MASDRFGIMFGMRPEGMWCLAACSRIWRNWASPVLQEMGRSKREKLLSVSEVKESQFAFLRFVKVWRGSSEMAVEKVLPSEISIGRWSELRVVRVDHSVSMAM